MAISHYIYLLNIRDKKQKAIKVAYKTIIAT